MKAVIVGTFDPITIGHESLIRKASENYDEVVVGVGINPDKTCIFSMDERVEMIKKVVAKYSNVSCQKFTGLTVDFASEIKADVIIKGIRNKVDFEYEMKQACYNKKLNPNITTKFFRAEPTLINVSSTLVRQKAYNGEDYSSLIPKEIIDDIKNKLK